MIEGWRKSLEKAKQEAAKGDLDAAKDVEALTLWIQLSDESGGYAGVYVG
jgi:hypothetical protein